MKIGNIWTASNFIFPLLLINIKPRIFSHSGSVARDINQERDIPVNAWRLYCIESEAMPHYNISEIMAKSRKNTKGL